MSRDGARILLTSSWYPSFDLPGRAIFVADQAEALASAGFEVDIASWEAAHWQGACRIGDEPADHGPAQAAWHEAITGRSVGVVPVSWGARGVAVTRLPAAVPLLAGAKRDPRLAAASAADSLIAWSDRPGFVAPVLVHAHVGLPDGLAAVSLAEHLGVPLVTTEHSSLVPAQLSVPGMREAYLALLGDGRMLLAVSRALRDRLAAALGVEPERIGVVPNVVDVRAFGGAAGDAARDTDELLWVGSLKAGKGINELLAAFARLHTSRPDLRLRLIGRAPSVVEEDRLRTLVVDLGVRDAVTFEGQVSREVVAAGMARAAVFVHPSPWETFGVVAAEALAAGLPVAAAPSGGVEEIVGRDGRFGEIAEDRSPEALASAVARVLDRSGSFDTTRMRASVQERFAPEVVARQLQACYAELLERSAPRHALAPAPRDRRAGSSGRSPVDTSRGDQDFRSGRLVVILAMQRSLATARVADLPAGIARGLVVVTTVGRDPGAPGLPVGPSWFELDPQRHHRATRSAAGARKWVRRPWRRMARLLRDPLQVRHPRRPAAGRPRSRVEGLRADLAALLASLGPHAGAEVVALSADDVDLVLPLLDDRRILSGGTLRGLVDQWDAAGRPSLAHPELSIPPTQYDPEVYWETLHRRGDLSTVGQSALSPELNAWLYRSLEANLRRFLRRHGVDRPVPQSAFDVGTGIGYWVRFWRSMGVSRVDGCDLVPAAVASATRVAREARAAGEFVVADLSEPGVLGSRSYDVVSCFNVLLHVVDEGAFSVALANVAGLVAEGGHLVLAEPILADPAYERSPAPARASKARRFAAYRDDLLASGLELVALEPAVVLANNPMEAGSSRMYRLYVRWWRFVVRQDRAGRTWIGPLVVRLDRLAMLTGQAPTTKFALFRRPPAGG